MVGYLNIGGRGRPGTFVWLRQIPSLSSDCNTTPRLGIIGGGKHNRASVIEQIPMCGYIIRIFAQILGSLQ